MNSLDSLQTEIEKTKEILAESQENYRNNPESYSAKLLLISTENHLADLLKKLDELKGSDGQS